MEDEPIVTPLLSPTPTPTMIPEPTTGADQIQFYTDMLGQAKLQTEIQLWGLGILSVMLALVIVILFFTAKGESH
ncbi:hypothetical protein [Paenibacillus odorifer]|uniref:hypothetical protein n=1 Tax=Paenibacillus odorifer TaxID=189426 RepID=UPI0020BEDA3F|nr:hypothetical protein [Paenibacillus odorifer]